MKTYVKISSFLMALVIISILIWGAFAMSIGKGEENVPGWVLLTLYISIGNVIMACLTSIIFDK